MSSYYDTSQFKKGLKLQFDGQPYNVVDSEFRKPGKGQAVYTLRVKNLLTGNVVEKNFRSGDKIEAADVHETNLQYLYNDSTHWHFMHPETFEQYAIAKGALGDDWKYLVEEMKVGATFWNGQPITITCPNHVVLAVTYCEPGARGNTATNVLKPAQVETGGEFGVPIFINIGDLVKIDTRTGSYVERVQNR
jgi:elongation factor P